jgi:hypothetical protein
VHVVFEGVVESIKIHTTIMDRYRVNNNEDFELLFLLPIPLATQVLHTGEFASLPRVE